MTAPTASDRWIILGFRAASLVNVLGVLLFSAGFTNRGLSAHSPIVLSRFGLVAIVLWGLAYLAVARDWARVPWLVAVFAVEKLVYVATWGSWMSRFASELPRLWSDSPLTATFFAIYGPNDLLFAVFFAWAAAVGLRRRAP